MDPTAVKPAVIMALTGVLGVALYKLLKRVFVRERPFITHSTIDLAVAPLDRYSFPSGHTLHAVSFAWQATAHFPELGWVLVPLAALIAARASCWDCTIRLTFWSARPSAARWRSSVGADIMSG